MTYWPLRPVDHGIRRRIDDFREIPAHIGGWLVNIFEGERAHSLECRRGSFRAPACGGGRSRERPVVVSGDALRNNGPADDRAAEKAEERPGLERWARTPVR